MAADELIHVTRWHNGEKTYSPFSDGEMTRRRDAMQARMDEAGRGCDVEAFRYARSPYCTRR